jgi:hypothetical protein
MVSGNVLFSGTIFIHNQPLGKRMDKLLLSLCIMATLSTATVTQSFFGSNKAAEQQCQTCGKAIALQAFLENYDGANVKNEVELQSKLVKEYIKDNCTNSDKEIKVAIDYCNNQSINTLLAFWSRIGSAANINLNSPNPKFCHDLWIKAANALKARQISAKAHLLESEISIPGSFLD